MTVVPLFSDEAPSAIVSRPAFTRAVALASAITPARTAASPAGTALMRISSAPQGLIITAAGGDIELNIAVAGEVDARFSAVLPIDAVARLARRAPRSELVGLRILVGGEPDGSPTKVELAFGGCSFTLDCLPGEEFPITFPEDPEDLAAVKVPSAVFWNAIDGTLKAASTDTTRYYLNGIFMHVVEGKLAFAATDGHRLFVQRTNVSAPAKLNGILPSKVGRFLDVLLNGYAGARVIEIRMSASFIMVSFDGVIMRAKMVEGTFPDYQRVIPPSNPQAAELKAEALLEGIQALTALAPRRTVRMRFEPDICRLSSTDPEFGSASAQLACQFQGEPFEIGFAADYLAAAISLASPDGRNVRIEMTAADKAVVITGSISGWSGILMPKAA